MRLPFTANDRPSVGVELELGLVDERTMALTSAIQPILAVLPAEFAEGVKPELMQSSLEVISGVCETIAEAERDLTRKLRAVQKAADSQGVRLLWSATHPFSSWREQEVTPTQRYQGLIDLHQDLARQLVTQGLHVHVGVDSGEKAILICNRMLEHLPLLLALSVNSPCWDGRVTGLQSYRSKVMEGLPTAGLPHQMANWSEYTWLIDHLTETGFINSIREIWWDIRPHNNFGTVEVRICDLPGSLDEAMTLAAMIQSMVVYFSDQIDEGSFPRNAHAVMVRQNKWRAARYGRRARLVDSYTYAAHDIQDLAGRWTERLLPVASRLECVAYLERLPALAAAPSAAARQLSLLEETGDPTVTVRRLTDSTRLTD